MKAKNVVFVAIVWLVSLVGVALWAQSGDVVKPPPGVVRAPTVVEGQIVGEVITGQNIGFARVAAQNSPGKVVGKWMVKIDGVWMEAQPYIGITR